MSGELPSPKMSASPAGELISGRGNRPKGQAGCPSLHQLTRGVML